MITNAEGKVLVSKDGTNALSNETVEAAKSDPAAKWILNTSVWFDLPAAQCRD